MNAPARVAKLSSYLRDLIDDVAKQGKVAKIVGNPVEVAAVAILSGSIAVVEAFWADVRLLAGNAKVQGQALARPMVEGAAARGVGMLFDKLFGQPK
jgi:hypothetical protein